jgi:hypothetical protein
MTKRSIERRLDDLEGVYQQPSCATLLVPSTATETDVEYSVEGVTASVEEDDEAHESVVVPHYLPEWFRGGGITIMTYWQVLLCWVFMPDDLLKHEVSVRKENDEPIPPIVSDYDLET